MPSYTYLLADTITGTLITELPLTGVTYDQRVNDASHLQATLPLDALPGARNLVVTGRTSLYVLRGSVPQYGGPIWSRPYDKAARSLTISSDDFLSYLDRIRITTDLSYTNADQLAIMRSLVEYAMGKGGSDLQVAYDGPASSGTTRTRNYIGTDQAPVGQRLRELSAVDGGPDFRFAVRMENGYLRRVMQLGSPSLGRTWPTSEIVFDADADGVEFTFTEDASASASVIYATGAIPNGSAAGTLPPTYTADDPTVRQAGYPRLEASLTYNDITDTATLTAHATGALNVSRLPLQTAQIKVRQPADGSSSAPDLGEYIVGDQCQVWIGRGDALFTNGARITATITGVSVAVDDQGNDEVTVNLAPSNVVEGAQR